MPAFKTCQEYHPHTTERGVTAASSYIFLNKPQKYIILLINEIGHKMQNFLSDVFGL